MIGAEFWWKGDATERQISEEKCLSLKEKGRHSVNQDFGMEFVQGGSSVLPLKA